MEKLFTEIDKLQQEINSRRPFDKRLLEQIREYYKIGLTYTSNALENNSLTETETKIILEDGITIGGKRLVEHYEAVGHAEAYNHLYTLASSTELREEDVKKLHHLFYYRIDEKYAGAYRDIKVIITGSRYTFPEPQLVAHLMKEFIIKTQEMRKRYHPVEYAARIHKDFVFIHPFIDGNGRVARLIMNLMLMQYHYTIAIIPPIMRGEYLGSLEKAHTNDKEFIELIARMVKETQKDYIRLFL